MGNIRFTMAVFPLLLCFLLSTVSALPAPNTRLLCNETEKYALLTFKHAILTLEHVLYNPGNCLSTWSAQEDCCGWHGVHCDNITSRVLRLDLKTCWLDGKVSPALLQLEFLNYLDLSYNDFGGAPIPSFLGSMRSLTHLDLTGASFSGLIPPQLGNLSNLHSLHLGGSFSPDDEPPPLYVENLKWISGLFSLQVLVMYSVDLHRAVDWLESINMLSSLSVLYFEKCNLDNMNPSLVFVNFTSLTDLSLSGNRFNHEMPHWVFNLPRLNFLDLSDNELSGQIPEYLGQLKHLELLYLHYNFLDGPIPSSIGDLSSLGTLYLYGNRLNGTLPSSLGLLSNLERLYIGKNSFAGTISEVHFNKLSKLMVLDISYSPSLVFKVDPNWVPPFQLKFMWMRSCRVGPRFPTWLQTQTSLRLVDISNSTIMDSVPTGFWNWASHIKGLILSSNQITGNLSEIVLNSSYIDLSSNGFEGELPRLSSNVEVFKVANNSFSGSITPFLCQKLNGKSKLQVLDMSTNSLSGELLQCWKNWLSLTHLNLGNNYLFGEISGSMGSLFHLQALHLHNNSLFGNIPPSLQNCIYLGLLDLGSNQFSGNIPSWLGQSTNLVVLILRSNKLVGMIPPQICQLSLLIVLDFAENNLSGPIPKCFNNFNSMTIMDAQYDFYPALEYGYYGREYENVMLVIKGREYKYNSILKLVRTIDLSSNNLSGSIPNEISSLFALQSLNLSFNHLMGSIPEKIGSMRSLECLDLSRNLLSGEIPQNMNNLTFLHHLNLSYNNLSGRIPSSTQFQSFDAFNYIGNGELCGAPLPNNCTEDEELKGMNTIDENDEGSKIQWFYIGMVFGFILGFWGVCGPLILKRSWRHIYFEFVHVFMDWVYVVITIRWKRLQNILSKRNDSAAQG